MTRVEHPEGPGLITRPLLGALLSAGDPTDGGDGDDGDDEPSPSTPANAPRRIGQFTLLRTLGEGGMGLVHAAYDEALDRKVALKLLRSDLRHGSEAAVRMLREAQALARLSHPNVVQVYEVGAVDGQVFIAMEYIAGVDGRAWLAARPRSWQEALAVYRQAGAGLAAAHRAGLVHRDFKPDNLLIGADGRVCVVDFGLAASHADAEAPREPHARPPAPVRDVALTATNTTLGTPAYMSPEQHLLRPTDARSDQYSFCVALYEAVYGTRPYLGQTVEEIRRAVIDGPAPVPPPGSAVPHRLRAALLRGLALAPEDRWPNMEALLAELSPPRRGPLWFGAGIAATAGVAAALALGGQDLSERLCGASDASLDAVWNPQRRAALEAHVVALAGPGSTVWPQLSAELEDRVAAMRASYRRSCEAARVHRTTPEALLGVRIECLDERRDHLDAGLDIVLRGQLATAREFLTHLVESEPVARCEQRERPPVIPAPPASQAQAEAIAAARSAATRIRARLDLPGADETLQPEIRELVRRAEELAYPPLIAEARALQGEQEVKTGDPARGIATLTDALATAEASLHIELARALWHRVLLLRGVHLDEVETALSLLPLLDAAEARSGPGGDPLAVLGTKMNLHILHGDLDQARGFAETGLAAARARASGAEDPRLFAWHLRLAVICDHQGRYAEAAAHLRTAEGVARSSLLDEHATLPALYLQAGNNALRRDATDEAGQYFKRSVTMWRALVEADHPDVASPLLGLMAVQLARGELAAARASLLEIQRRTARLSANHRLRGSVHALAAALRLREGDSEGALAEAREARQILDHNKFVDPLLRIRLALDVAAAEARLGRPADAAASLRAALDAPAPATDPDTAIARLRTRARAQLAELEPRDAARSPAHAPP